MPSVGRALGGYAYFGWATAGFLLGSVLAGASSGLLAQRFGLRRATAAAAVLYAAGCVMSAAGPDIATFLIGVLPTYDQIGIWAPAVLILMRFCQGLGVGGEPLVARLGLAQLAAGVELADARGDGAGVVRTAQPGV